MSYRCVKCGKPAVVKTTSGAMFCSMGCVAVYAAENQMTEHQVLYGEE